MSEDRAASSSAGHGVCVITGGGRGIGAAVAAHVACAGWTPCISWVADEDTAQTIAAAVGGVAVRADVSVEEDVIELFRAASELGPITAAVANAGIAGAPSDLAAMSGDRLRRSIDVNVLGTLYTAREAVRAMSPAEGGSGGSIVAVSSAAVRQGAQNVFIDYAASKGSVDALVVGLAREVGQLNIRVNAVRPGIIDTDIHASGGDPDRASRLAPAIPLGRAGTSDEIAHAIRWLLSDSASYVSGAILDVSGGR